MRSPLRRLGNHSFQCLNHPVGKRTLPGITRHSNKPNPVISAWNQFVAEFSGDDTIAQSAHLLYDTKMAGVSRRLCHLSARPAEAILETEDGFEFQKARSNVRAILADVAAYVQLRRTFLGPLTNQLGEVCLVSSEEITGSKLPNLRKRWTDLAAFSFVRFEVDAKRKGEFRGTAHIFAEVAVKTSVNPSSSIKRGVEQFRYREEKYWAAGGSMRFLAGNHQGTWQPDFAKDLPQSRWIMVAGLDLPPEGASHKEDFLLIPLAVTAETLDAKVDKIVQEVKTLSLR